MKKHEKILSEKPNIVKDYYIGGTRVIVADNYAMPKDGEEFKKSLARIALIAQRSNNGQLSGEMKIF